MSPAITADGTPRTSEASLVVADAVHIAVAAGIAAAGARVTFFTADERQAAAAEPLLDEVRLLT